MPDADCAWQVEGEELPAHRIVLTARSPVFHALLNSGMREGAEGVVKLEDVRAPVFRALLHFVYTDALPQVRLCLRGVMPVGLPGACMPGAEVAQGEEVHGAYLASEIVATLLSAPGPQELEGAALEVAMAQHLLVAADRFQLGRLRRICERRLCETVEVETAATTLALAEQNHANELKRVCLDFVSRNLQAVMTTDGYQHMVQSCPQLQVRSAALLHRCCRAGDRAAPAGDSICLPSVDACVKQSRRLSLRALRQAELLRVIAIATQERNYHHGHRARQVARAAHAPGERPRAEDGRDEAGGDDDARRVRQRRE